MAVRYVLSDYVAEALAQAVYEKVEDGSYVGRIPSCPGAAAVAGTLRQCEESLRSTLEDWILLGLRMGHALPVVAGIDLNREPVRDVGAADSRPPRALLEMAGRYGYILAAPRGLKTKRVREFAKEIGRSNKTVWKHLSKIARGETTGEGLPLVLKPGPPPGHGSSLEPWMQELIRDASGSPGVTPAQCLRLIRESMLSHACKKPLPSSYAVGRFLRRARRRATTGRA